MLHETYRASLATMQRKMRRAVEKVATEQATAIIVKFLQTLPLATQTYIRDKDPATPEEAADLASKFAILNNIDEFKHDSGKGRASLSPHIYENMITSKDIPSLITLNQDITKVIIKQVSGKMHK